MRSCAGSAWFPRGCAVDARALSGGISNIVLAASWPGGRAVLKQSLPELRVAVEWRFDRGRIINERRAMSYLGQVLPAASVPVVLAHDDEAFLFAMSHAPDGGVNWKDALLRGDIDLQAAERAGALLGEIHRRSAGDAGVARDFADLTPLLQGRVDPYHRTAAAVNPGVARRDRSGGGAAAGDAPLPGARRLVAEEPARLPGPRARPRLRGRALRRPRLRRRVPAHAPRAQARAPPGRRGAAARRGARLPDGVPRRCGRGPRRPTNTSSPSSAACCSPASTASRGSSTCPRRSRACTSAPSPTTSCGPPTARSPAPSTACSRREPDDRLRARARDPRLTRTADRRGGAPALRRDDHAGKRPLRRLHRPARGGRAPGRRSRAVRRARRAPRGRGREHRDRRGHPRRRRRPRRGRPDPHRARRHAGQVAPRRQRHPRRLARLRARRGRRRRPAALAAPRCATPSRCCRCRWSTSSAADCTPGASSTSRTSW